MRGAISTAIIALAALAALPASAQDSRTVLHPLSDWQIDRSQDSCVLTRSFGDERSPLFLELRQYAPGTPFFATVAMQQPFSDDPAPHFRFVGTDAGSVIGIASLLELSEGYRGVRARLYAGSPRGDSWTAAVHTERDEHEMALSQITIDGAFSEDLILESESMLAPLAALRDCHGSLIEAWGIDADAHRTLSQRAVFDWRRSRFFDRRSTLPRDVRRQLSQGLLPVRVIINEEGRVSDCQRLTPMGDDAALTQLCDLLIDTLRYDPAEDASGESIQSYDVWGIAPIRFQAN